MERPKRLKKETTKSKAFEKLKQLKSSGIKHKYEVTPTENVYEVVSEKVYTETVLKRQNDDWIVDDYGIEGYVEDGREIFDDDLDEESIKKERKLSKKRDHSGTLKTNEKPKNSIDKMLANLPMKKKEIKIDADSVINDIMNEICSEPKEKCAEVVEKYKQLVKVEEKCTEFEEKSIEPAEKFIKSIENDREPEEKCPIVAEESTKPILKKLEDNLIIDDYGTEGCEIPTLVNNFKENDSQFSKFYYWDAYEDFFNQGTVYLFGKVFVSSSKTYASCCVIVRNIERKIFLLPREKKQSTNEEVSMTDVYNEFNKNVSERYKIMKFKARKVSKNYAFDLIDVPDSCEYLEVQYSAKNSALPINLNGDTFSRVFGTNTSFLEILLIEKRIKGPCWLQLEKSTMSNPPISWCKYEVVIDDMKEISVLGNTKPPPPLVIATINLRIIPIPKSHDNQITMIGCLIHNNYCTNKAAPAPPFEQSFCVFTKPVDAVWPYDYRETVGKFNAVKLEKMDSERALLSFFLAKFYKIDPDLVIGFDIYGFDIGTLIHRLTVNKIMHWSRLGRLRVSNASSFGKSKTFLERNVMCGRLLCDVKLSAKELIRARSYDLDTLCQQILHISEGERKDYSSDEIKAMYTSSHSLLTLITSTMQDTSFILRIMYDLNVIPLSLQITNIAGNVLSRTLMGGRAERNEYLLLHAFNEKNYIVPDKKNSKKPSKEDILADTEQNSKGKRKPQYEGGLVLDPKIGFYDKLILLMDFNSLYPSIIQEYNICFTTVTVRELNCDKADDVMMLMHHLPTADQPGILPAEIRKLVESRREVKKLMANPNISADLKHQYDIRQMALKLTANSMYGCLGFQYSRFYAKPLAAMVTAKGREILINTRDLVQRLNFEVIYGDTDSLMILTNSVDYDEVFKLGHKIKVEVNKLYKQIELDIDGVFKYMLLLKKKKYAAVSLSKVNGQLIPKQEIKGLDVVRRDWSQLAAAAGKFVLAQILSDQNLEDKLENIHTRLRKLKNDLEENKVQLPLLTINKQLTKNPEDYSDKKSLIHVQVALRMNSTMSKKLKRGDTVTYVICEDGTNNPATQRAYHVDELKNNDKLKIDVTYYLSQQIHPVVNRLCEPIDGIDAVQIAQSLGLDISAYQHIERLNATLQEADEINLDDADKYKNCEKFIFKCNNPKCSVINIVESSVITEENGIHILALSRCSNKECTEVPFLSAVRLKNLLWLKIRSFIHKYYLNWMICEDPTCGYRTRTTGTLNKNLQPICMLCKRNNLIREYSEAQLYNQLCYFQYIFDINNAMNNYKNLNVDHKSEIYKAYCGLQGTVDRALKLNAYNIIDLSKLFELIFMR